MACILAALRLRPLPLGSPASPCLPLASPATAYLNVGEAFLYSWCWFASGLAVLGTYYPRFWPVLTTAFLAGMAPVGLAFGGLCWWRLNRIW